MKKRLKARRKLWLKVKATLPSALEIAEEHDIHIHRDADLMTVLEAVELNHEIPLEVYAVVAEIFAYIYRMNNEKKNA